MSQPLNEPIAIIGSGCRFPSGVSSPSKLWDLLSNPRDVSSEIGGEGRFNLDRFYHPDGGHRGTTNTRPGYLLSDNIRHFDSKFFFIPPGEAEAIDPQQRLLLELACEALEGAGLTVHGLGGSNTEVYTVHKYAATGTAASNASSRISYDVHVHTFSNPLAQASKSSYLPLPCYNACILDKLLHVKDPLSTGLQLDKLVRPNDDLVAPSNWSRPR
ncbi:beta-ketoacyl synthase [Schizothecium vesticola]|uniref:Beta-ketoacyl synthase n=1 Tax=Schizothecium vesticola TaxID=314040 RepID=A0AA40KCZ8_9PEZI|nr:beta-ketoacyl synthase [Schizothecium vesticola]